MKKLIGISIAILGMIGAANAQQLPLYSQYYAIPFLQNPSLAGNTDFVNASLIHKSMWKDIPGAPVTSAFTVEGPVQEKNIGLGAVLFSDVTDIVQRTGFSTSYSYKLWLNDDTKILFGASLGIIDTKIDFTRAIVKDVNDPMLLVNTQHRTVFDAAFGSTFIWKTLEIGVAAPQLLGNKVEMNSGPNDASYVLARHFMFSAKYGLKINDNGLFFYPLVMVRYAQNTPLQYDVNAILDLEKRGWFAITYRSNYAIGLNLGIRINKTLRAGYAYDLAIGKIASYAGGSHELMLGYTFGGKKEDKKGSDPSQAEKDRMKQDMMTDSMMIVLKKENQANKEQIDQLKQQLDSVKKNSNSGGGNSNNNNGQPHQEANNNVKPDSTGSLRKAAAVDFKDEDGKEIIPNYYVIVGAFKSKDGAASRKADYLKRGFPLTSFLYNEKKQLYYVTVISTANEEAANRELADAKYGTPDAWVFELK